MLYAWATLLRGECHAGMRRCRTSFGALLSAYLGIAEASSRTGADRISRFRTARGEASEAAAALEAVAILGLAPDTEIEAVMSLLDRLCAMLTRLAGMHRHQP